MLSREASKSVVWLGGRTFQPSVLTGGDDAAALGVPTGLWAAVQ